MRNGVLLRANKRLKWSAVSSIIYHSSSDNRLGYMSEMCTIVDHTGFFSGFPRHDWSTAPHFIALVTIASVNNVAFNEKVVPCSVEAIKTTFLSI